MSWQMNLEKILKLEYNGHTVEVYWEEICVHFKKNYSFYMQKLDYLPFIVVE